MTQPRRPCALVAGGAEAKRSGAAHAVLDDGPRTEAKSAAAPLTDPRTQWRGVRRVGGHLSIGRVLPGLGVGAAGVLALLTGVPVVALLAVVTLLALTAWARSLAVRVMVGLLVVLALAAMALWLPTVRWGSGALVLVVVGLTLLQVVVAQLRPSERILPELDRADAIALVGGALLTVMLAAPYIGRSADDVLLDLARGFDPVNHVLGVTNLMVERGASWTSPQWPSPDGSTPVMVGYPLGFHAVIAAALSLEGVQASRDLVVAYAWAAVASMGICAAILGWITVRIARALGSSRSSESRAVWSAAGYAACCLLGGTFVAPFVLGHAPFMVAATAGIAASWMALELLQVGGPGLRRGPPSDDVALAAQATGRTARAAAALGALVTAAVALYGSYPPLIAGLIPAGGALVWSWSRPPAARWARPVALGMLALLPVLLLWLWRGRLEHLVLSVGENSTPFLVSVILVVLTAGVAWIAWDQGWGLAPARALAVAGGYLLAGLVLAVAAVLQGLPAAESYYGTKLAEAAWLAALPVLTALVAAAVVQGTAARGRRTAMALCTAGMLALAVVVGALPVGRETSLLVGPGALTQRLVEAQRAHGQISVLEAARLAGPSTGDASAMIDPPGWFFPVERETQSGPALRREAVSAALWLSTLRGVRTQETDEVADCFVRHGDASALPCVARWLGADQGRRITLVTNPSSPSTQQVEAWAGERASQVTVVALPAAAAASTAAGR